MYYPSNNQYYYLSYPYPYHYLNTYRNQVPYYSFYNHYRVPTNEQINGILNCINQGSYRLQCFEQFGLHESEYSYMNDYINRVLGADAGMPQGAFVASSSPFSHLPDLPSPSGTDEEIINANGKKLRCHWVYCCEPIEQESVMPSCTEPGPNEDKFELSSPPIEGIPEFKVNECGNEFGFCLNTRTSTLRLIARVVYPKDAADAVKEEIKQCFEVALQQALLAATPYFATMAAQPETVPALLPQAVEAALQRGTLSFKECMLTKATVSYLFNSGLIKFCVFHVQESGNDDWRLLNSRDIIRIFDKLLFLSTAGMAMAFFPGVGSFEQVAQKLGIDTNKLSENISKGFEHYGEEGQKLLNRLKITSKNPVGSAISGVKNLGNKTVSAVEDLVKDPVKKIFGN
ncbi:hypothetical protein D3C74_213530 [compost metagenome]